MRTRLSLLAVALTALMLGPPACGQQDQATGLFDAAEAGQIDLKVIPKNAQQATILIQNNTDQPLKIKLPAAFAGVPVLAQGDGGLGRGGGGGNNFGGGGGGVNQSFGGGFGGGMMGGGMMGGGMMGGGGMFDIGPDAVGKLKVGTVCLEHGKEDPKPKIPYELKPIDSVTDDGRVIEICRMMANGEIDQSSAQAATWHVLAGLSWQELASKVKVRHLNGSTEMYFHPRQLHWAAQTVQEAARRADAAGHGVDQPATEAPEEKDPYRRRVAR